MQPHLVSVSKHCPFLNHRAIETQLNGGVAFVSRTIIVGGQHKFEVTSQEARGPAGAWLDVDVSPYQQLCGLWSRRRLLLEPSGLMTLAPDIFAPSKQRFSGVCSLPAHHQY